MQLYWDWESQNALLENDLGFWAQLPLQKKENTEIVTTRCHKLKEKQTLTRIKKQNLKTMSTLIWLVDYMEETT